VPVKKSEVQAPETETGWLIQPQGFRSQQSELQNRGALLVVYQMRAFDYLACPSRHGIVDWDHAKSTSKA
jgi:hypothetical protein